MFNGQSNAAAFWKSGNSYRVFNSHSIGNDGLYDPNGNARLFLLKSLPYLAKCLLANAAYDSIERQYEIGKILTRREADISRPQKSTASTTMAAVTKRTKLSLSDKRPATNIIKPCYVKLINLSDGSSITASAVMAPAAQKKQVVQEKIKEAGQKVRIKRKRPNGKQTKDFY